MTYSSRNWLLFLEKPSSISYVMRFVFMLLTCTVLQVSATGFGQNIYIKQKQTTIRNIFKSIKKQTGYDILWRTDQINIDKEVEIPFKNISLNEILDILVKNTNLKFKIEEHTIVIISRGNSIYEGRHILQDSVVYKGRILNEKGQVLSGATVRIKNGTSVTKSGNNGEFHILATRKAIIVVTFIGYIPREITLSGNEPSKYIDIQMSLGENQLGEINVVTTGYQDLPKERATGSFEVITKELLQHSSDPNLLKRLEGITTSMDFNNQLRRTNSAGDRANTTPILYNLTIRGRNTLNVSNTDDNPSGVPLVVIDGIASPYPIDQVNPNDVESITILKDAASASIWGSRAANGVIVIKTKKAGFDRPLNISLNANFNYSDKFNLFYKNYMSTSDFIDALVFQYNRVYNPLDPNAYVRDATDVINPTLPISPIFEILNQQKMGKITLQQMNSQIDVLRNNDIRNDFEKYILRNQATQSYSIALDGGTKKMSQRVSFAYDETLNNTIHSDNNRFAFNYVNSFRPLKNLEFNANFSYNLSRTNDQAQQNIITANTGSGFYPFTRLVDDQGNNLPITKRYRNSFIDLVNKTYGNKILDMTYVPLDDINEGYYKTSLQNVNFNLGGKYQINNVVSLSTTYNYNRGDSEINQLLRQNSYYMRELINRFTTPSGDRNIPLGGQYKPIVTTTHTQTIRGQLNVDKNWNNKHQLSAIAGVDVSEYYRLYREDLYYGYDDRSLLVNSYRLNYSNNLFLPLWGDPSSGLSRTNIPYNYVLNDLRSRTFSTFSNAAYTYNNKYTISASIRKDLDSQFGLGTNKGGTPFFSIGSKWNIANEAFYNISWLPVLQLRSTFGYNGNVNPLVSARPIIIYSTTANSTSNLLFAATSDELGVSNNKLRPEKTGILNLGVDFGSRNNRIFGSFEYYNKRTKDLLSNIPLDPTTGLRSATVNTADLHSWGTDLTLNSSNIQSKFFRWNTNFLMSYNQVKVTKLYSDALPGTGNVMVSTTVFEEGKSINRLYGYRWAGLDPNTGDPRGYLNGQIVSISANGVGNAAFNGIYNSPTSSAHYFGSSVPVYFGSLRNTFSYQNLSLSFNVLYKLGYYFRRPPSEIVRYSQLFSSSNNSLQGIEYLKRWQKPGDEEFTNVPSLTYPATSNRDAFYQYSEINVLKADQVRLQEINFSYAIGAKKWLLKNARLFTNISNLGIIWRANKYGLDPDINDYPNPRTYALGLSANF